MTRRQNFRWAELSHAYGPAGNIESLLEALRVFPDESDSRAEPWHTLWSCLYHQGDVYSASFAAVPVIFDVMATDPGRATASFFQLPACIELARVDHLADVPEFLQVPYSEAWARVPGLVTLSAKKSWSEDVAGAALAALAVAQGQWSYARLLTEVEGVDLPEVLKWYRAR